jgi:predicted small metal-binding protein
MQLACKDMGMEHCSFMAHGSTPEEVKDKMMDHASHVHKDMMNGMSPEEKEKMKNKMDEMLAMQT